MSVVCLAAHQALTPTVDLFYHYSKGKQTHTNATGMSIMGGKTASPGYLIVTSGILEDVISDKNRRASLCVGLSGKRRSLRQCGQIFLLHAPASKSIVMLIRFERQRYNEVELLCWSFIRVPTWQPSCVHI